MSEKANEIIVDVAGLSGLAAVGYGVWQMHPASAFVTVGILLLAYAVRAAK